MLKNVYRNATASKFSKNELSLNSSKLAPKFPLNIQQLRIKANKNFEFENAFKTFNLGTHSKRYYEFVIHFLQ